MTTTNVPLFEHLCNMLAHTEPDFLRNAVAMLFQQLMEADVSRHIGATRHQRTGMRATTAINSVVAASILG